MLNFLTQLLYIIIAYGVAVILFLFIGTIFINRRKKRKFCQKEERLAELLGEKELKDILDDSPYQYGRWQGEDGYRIYDLRIKNNFIASARSKLDAEIWIVEQYLSVESTKTVIPYNHHRDDPIFQ